jgi:hypothetical protein
MDLTSTVVLPVVRGPVVLTKILAVIDLLSGSWRSIVEITRASTRRSPGSNVPVSVKNLSNVKNIGGGYGFTLAATEYTSCWRPPRSGQRDRRRGRGGS